MTSFGVLTRLQATPSTASATTYLISLFFMGSNRPGAPQRGRFALMLAACHREEKNYSSMDKKNLKPARCPLYGTVHTPTLLRETKYKQNRAGLRPALPAKQSKVSDSEPWHGEGRV